MSEPVPSLFDYQALDVETCQFVQQKADETHGLLKRTADHILRIGQNLRAVKEKLPHGQFLSWVRTEFGMSRWTAQNFIRVAERLEDKWGNFHHLPLSVLYELAASSTSEDILAQVQDGQIPSTREAVKEAKEAERLARAAEQQARLEAERVRQQLAATLTAMQEKQATIERLGQEIARLQVQMDTPASPPTAETREVAASATMPEVQQQITSLQQRLQTMTQQRDDLARQVHRLTEEAQASAQKRNEGEPERRIRLNWYQITTEFQASVARVLARWPSFLDTQAFEAEDWQRLSHMRETARRVLNECSTLTQQRIVESPPS